MFRIAATENGKRYINFGSAERFPSNIKDSVNLKIMFVREPVISYKVSTEMEADSCVDSELQEEVSMSMENRWGEEITLLVT